MVSASADVARWAEALYGGAVLEPAQLEAMLADTILPDGRATGYGLGVYLETVEGAPTVGHSGSTQGYQSRMRYRDDGGGGTAVATLCNNFFSEADEIDLDVWALEATWE